MKNLNMICCNKVMEQLLTPFGIDVIENKTLRELYTAKSIILRLLIVKLSIERIIETDEHLKILNKFIDHEKIKKEIIGNTTIIREVKRYENEL